MSSEDLRLLDLLDSDPAFHRVQDSLGSALGADPHAEAVDKNGSLTLVMSVS